MEDYCASAFYSLSIRVLQSHKNKLYSITEKKEKKKNLNQHFWL